MHQGQSPTYLAEIKARGPVYIHVLEIPIPGSDGTPVDKLEFREPTAGDILLCGNPVAKFDPTTWTVRHDQKSYFDMLAALSGVSVPFLMRMSPNDLTEIEARLDHFFIPGFRTRPEPNKTDGSSPLVVPPAP